jgi:plastocyanin
MRSTPSIRLAALVIVLAVAAVAGCGGDDEAPTNPPAGALEDTIRIVSNAAQKMSMAYSPNPDTVAKGTTVRWINQDSATHTATSDFGAPENFNITIAPGSQGVRKFDNAGSFPYYCAVTNHQMNGNIVVLP